jgi:CheY-like chemotaxis protein
MKPPEEQKILVVEDDTLFQRVLHRRLTVEGYQVFLAGDGREGMRAIVTHEPDLVISDWMMPEVDGLELCQSVKTGLGEAAPYFLLLTAKGEISDKLLALETGADDYLVKPCDQGELMARVRAGLRIVELTQTLRRAVEEARKSAGDSTGVRTAGLCPRCRRAGLPDGTWIDPADFLRSGGVIARVMEPCPTCRVIGRFGAPTAGAERAGEQAA